MMPTAVVEKCGGLVDRGDGWENSVLLLTSLYFSFL